MNPRFENQCRDAALTAGKIDISRLLRKGFGNKENASEPDLPVKAVRNHITAVFRKMDVSGRPGPAMLERERDDSRGIPVLLSRTGSSPLGFSPFF